MKKRLLKSTEQEVVVYFNQLPKRTQWEWIVTPYRANTQEARLRRLLVKATNDRNRKLI